MFDMFLPPPTGIRLMLPNSLLPLNALFSRAGQLNTLLHLKCADLLITLFSHSQVPWYFFLKSGITGRFHLHNLDALCKLWHRFSVYRLRRVESCGWLPIGGNKLFRLMQPM